MRLIRVLLGALAVLGAMVLLITFTPLVRMTASAMQQSWYDGGGEVLVVLGGSMLVPGTGPDAAMGDDTYLRCVYASWVLKRQSFRYTVLSGGEGLARVMAHFLVNAGIPEQSLMEESRSLSTYENAINTRRLLESRYGAGRVPPVVVLTSDFHSWRARRTFEHCGLRTKTIAIPDVIKRSRSLPYRWTGAMTISGEFAKDFFYTASGKL